jgi:hypothetical protein
MNAEVEEEIFLLSWGSFQSSFHVVKVDANQQRQDTKYPTINYTNTTL